MVAITGATGLLGSHIIDKFLEENVKITAILRDSSNHSVPPGVIQRQADVTDPVSLREAFEGATTVVHAAAYVSFNPRKRQQIQDVNIGGTRNVIDSCLELGVKNFIHVSSVAALGRKPLELITEDSKWTSTLSSYYGESKYLAELEVFRGAEEGLNVSIINPSMILSASAPHRSSGQLFEYVAREKSFYTDGALNYVDARDVADAIYQLYKKPLSAEKFILSAGSISFLDFFTQVAKHFNKRPPSLRISPSIAYWAGWIEEVRCALLNREPLVTRQSALAANQSFQYDNRKAREILGVRFKTLDETLAWCCSNYLQSVKPNK